MKFKKPFLYAFSFLLSTLLFVSSAFADFGNFDTYDDGSRYSGSWDTSSDRDLGWNSGGYYYFSDYDDYHSDSDDDFMSFVIVLVIIMLIIFIAAKKGGKVTEKATPQRKYQQNYTPIVYKNKNSEIASLIQKTDTAFSSDKFISFANEAYVKLQGAWCERDIEPIRLLLSEELFAQTFSQVQEYRRLKRINKMERIAVQESYITDYIRDNEKETLTVYLYATQKDYIVDESTDKVLEGSTEQYRHSKYLINFIRAAGTLTSDNNGILDTNCPNCGAPLEITASGKCPYCDSVITNEDHSWVISSMKRVN